MRLTRVHVDAALREGDELALLETSAAHLTRVLRLQAGDACVVFDGRGFEADARLVAIDKRGARVQIGAVRRPDNESPLRITLLQGVARGEKMDLILQKGTELGVTAFVPVFSDRSEVKLDGARAAKRLEHWRGVVTSACEQSGRAFLPDVASPQPLANAMAALPAAARLLLDPVASMNCRSALAANTRDVVLAVGPEGGWSPQDRSLLEAQRFLGVRLGPRVLRTETAGLAAIAALQALHGDFD
ncbi:16S rRNA (uracil(1498)-N(3))-methyltransferase [Solilutibacter silvestris]|uniref:Ribosomal RNA small subunit methyltransferase E n=1 Tax=Solilutibacter silvestris TaxID=1645665 RepID=A0A2K1PXG6_9GAMM|nr:16S rRNA (uracil(1498)-N(3))-methyltransferase [Lysobacter silvestris]PNS07486.1 RNA methyltransferase, RsmE family [Lysobacter silvestris]